MKNTQEIVERFSRLMRRRTLIPTPELERDMLIEAQNSFALSGDDNPCGTAKFDGNSEYQEREKLG